MELALQIVQLFNTAGPGIAQLIILLRKKDGTVSVLTLLDEADAQIDKNIKQLADWLKEHPKS